MTAAGHDNPVARAHVSMMHRLAQAAAGSSEPEQIVEAAWAELPLMVGTDAAGLVLFDAKKVWVWAKPDQHERGDSLRSRLSDRLGPSSRQRPVGQKPRRPLRRAHLSLVPKDDDAVRQHEDQTGYGCEILMAAGGSEVGVLRVERSDGPSFTDEEQQVLSTSAALLGLAFGHLQAQRALQDLALRDSLTGVLTRRALEEPLQRELKAGLRYGTPASLLLMDLDYFTTVNNRLGHAAGDDVLKAVALLIQENVRAVDCVGRYGGEQFSVVLPHTDVQMAQTLAERIRADVERHAFDVEDGQVRITVSLGVASLQDASITNVERWIAAADAALCEAKAKGRNRVATHDACNPAPAATAVLRVARAC
jgi:diguanylate cyclase (GGDEF)-like protein